MLSLLCMPVCICSELQCIEAVTDFACQTHLCQAVYMNSGGAVCMAQDPHLICKQACQGHANGQPAEYV